MKKFLSLVLALVMTMSLVTVSAGATEYKDFTDKSEIQYEEAVTVLNKLGIITGYSEGDFRPQGELTRGAAAKIIVSLLIGPEAAEALGNETSPYPDVPAGNTFAGVISYCKTAKIISGYGDGTFRPTGTLTGYAFAKMLLGALGYDSSIEGFTGAGWNMNVAKLGGEAGLFDRITFNGNATVNREQACQLALNTLKGTMVEYSGGMNFTGSDGSTMVINATRDYKTSNQEFATHINNKKASEVVVSANTPYTVEFGEEHFVDLRLNHDRNTNDSFGRPSNEWSWKKVTIGTFPIEPDFVFTAQTAHLDKTDAEKNRATGLGGYDVECSGTADGQKYTRVWVNGLLAFGGDGKTARATDITTDSNGKGSGNLSVEDISDLTDNGTVVEVYVSDDTADFITDVVVVKTQLMEVRRVGSDYVALQREDNKDADKPVNNAYNQPVMDTTVEDIQSDDDVYSVVSGLKAGDLVAVVPVSQSATDPNTKYDVAEVYVPETVSGALSAVETYGAYTANTKDPVSVTVGGTKYNIALWSRDLLDINGDTIKVTRKDVTLYLDKNGNAMKIKDAGDVSGWFIVGRYYQTLVENRIVTMVEGWDTSGEKMELNLGTNSDLKDKIYCQPGDLVRYQSTASNNADWILTLTQEDDGKYHIVGDVGARPGTDGDIKASDVQIPVSTYPSAAYNGQGVKALNNTNVYTEKGVKFVYVTFDPLDNEVESISIKDGVQEVKATELSASKYLSQEAQVGYTTVKGGLSTADPDAIKVVVIKQESNDATASNLLYIRDQVGGAIKEADGTMIYCYTVAMMGPNGLVNDKMTIYSDDQMKIDTFAAYTQKEHEGYSDFYDLREHNNFTQNTTSTFEVSLGSFVTENGANVRVKNPEFVKGTGANMDIDGENRYNNGAVARPYIMSDPRDPDTVDDENGGESRHIRISSDTVFVDLRTTAQKDLTGNRTIDSRDDFKWVFENWLDKDGNWRIDKTNDITFLMQLVINDNESNNSFRTVSMVVITDQIALKTADLVSKYADLAPVVLDDAKALTLTTNTPETTVSNGGNVSMTSAQLAALTGANVITLTASPKATISNTVGKTGSVDVTLNAAATATPNVRTVTVNTAPDNGDTLTFTVEAEDGTTAPYTFKFVATDAPAPAKGNWNNDVAKTYATATNYSSSDWENLDETKVKMSGTTLVAPILNTGNVDDVKKQVVSALGWIYDVEAANITLLDERGTKLTYQVSYLGSTGATLTDRVEYDYGQDDILVKVQADLLEDVVYGIYDYDATISESSADASTTDAINTTANAGEGVKVLNKDGEFAARVIADADPAGDGSVDGTEDVNLVAGYTYILKAYTTFTTGADNSGASLDVTYVVGDETTARATYDNLIEEGDVVKIILTANAEIDLAGSAAGDVTFGSAVESIVCSNTAVVDGTPNTTKITFKSAAGTKLAKGDTITAVCGSVSKSEVYNGTAKSLPQIDWTAPTL